MLEEKLVNILTQIETLSKTMAPEVLNSAIEVTRMNGIIDIVTGVICFVISMCGAFAIVKYYKFCIRKKKEYRATGNYTIDWDFTIYVPCGIISAISSILLLASIFQLMDGWNYVAIFEPKLALARSIMEAASSAK